MANPNKPALPDLVPNKEYANYITSCSAWDSEFIVNDLRKRLSRREEQMQDLTIEIAALKSQESPSLASFKNFHRSLCDRFGYIHDPVDWQRDQVSLEEHISAVIDQWKEQESPADAWRRGYARGRVSGALPKCEFPPRYIPPASQEKP